MDKTTVEDELLESIAHHARASREAGGGAFASVTDHAAAARELATAFAALRAQRSTGSASRRWRSTRSTAPSTTTSLAPAG